MAAIHCPTCFAPTERKDRGEWGENATCDSCGEYVVFTRYGVRKMRKKERAALRKKTGVSK